MKILSIALPAKAAGRLRLATRISKPANQKLNLVQKPVIANLKSYYSSAEEKLNDIFLERIKKKESTNIVEYNKDQFDRLPQAIKDCIKPQDITNTGHIDQNYINELWDAAKKANKYGVYGNAPIFKGNMADELPVSYLENMPELTITGDTIDSLSNSAELAENLHGNIENISDVMSDVDEQGIDILDKIAEFIDRISDTIG